MSQSGWRSFTPEQHRYWTHPCLEKRASTIPGAGLGVFATHDLPAKTHLGYYVGCIHWTYPKHDDRHFAYIMEVSRRPPWISKSRWSRHRRRNEAPVINGCEDCILGYVNCCKGVWSKMNADFSRSGRFYTIKPVRRGEELFINYGMLEYWDTLEENNF